MARPPFAWGQSCWSWEGDTREVMPSCGVCVCVCVQIPPPEPRLGAAWVPPSITPRSLGGAGGDRSVRGAGRAASSGQREPEDDRSRAKPACVVMRRSETLSCCCPSPGPARRRAGRPPSRRTSGPLRRAAAGPRRSTPGRAGGPGLVGRAGPGRAGRVRFPGATGGSCGPRACPPTGPRAPVPPPPPATANARSRARPVTPPPTSRSGPAHRRAVTDRLPRAILPRPGLSFPHRPPSPAASSSSSSPRRPAPPPSPHVFGGRRRFPSPAPLPGRCRAGDYFFPPRPSPGVPGAGGGGGAVAGRAAAMAAAPPPRLR